MKTTAASCLNTRSFGERLRTDWQKQSRLARQHTTHYLFMLPYAVIFCVFTLLPVAIAIVLSFTSFNMLQAPTLVGVQNYFRLFFNDEIFITALKNTIILAAILGPGGYILSFMFAWFINELSHFMRVLFTIIFYAPSLAGGMSVIWTIFLSGDSRALVNGTLIRLGIIQDPINFFTNPTYMMPLAIIITLWSSLGTSFLSFVAGFQGVDSQYYEAAALDGIRNRWQELWYITLPLMRPQLFFGAVMSISGSFSVSMSGLCGSPSTDYAVHTITDHLGDYGGTRFEMGYACAIATILFFMMILANKAIQALIRKVGT